MKICGHEHMGPDKACLPSVHQYLYWIDPSAYKIPSQFLDRINKNLFNVFSTYDQPSFPLFHLIITCYRKIQVLRFPNISFPFAFCFMIAFFCFVLRRIRYHISYLNNINTSSLLHINLLWLLCLLLKHYYKVAQ